MYPVAVVLDAVPKIEQRYQPLPTLEIVADGLPDVRLEAAITAATTVEELITAVESAAFPSAQ